MSRRPKIWSRNWYRFIDNRINKARLRLERQERVRLRLDRRADRNMKFKNGVEEATLINIKHGYFQVLVDGYRRPTYYHPDFWIVTVSEKINPVFSCRNNGMPIQLR